MVVTGNPEIARRISVMRLHGIDREVWRRYTEQKASWQYDVVEAGFKYNLPDISAAIGRVQLKKAEAFLRRRRQIAQQYITGLSGCSFLRVPEFIENHAWHLFILRLRNGTLAIDRDEYIRRLQKAGIGISVHYIPLHIMGYYRRRYGLKAEDFPISMEVFRSVLSLPIYPDLKDTQVRRIIDTVRSIGEDASRGAVR